AARDQPGHEQADHRSGIREKDKIGQRLLAASQQAKVEPMIAARRLRESSFAGRQPGLWKKGGRHAARCRRAPLILARLWLVEISASAAIVPSPFPRPVSSPCDRHILPIDD